MDLNRFIPAELEGKWYREWLARNLFAPAGTRPAAAGQSGSAGAPFCIVIPPPNVTGSLHMGHAWDNALQDILIRWKRMQGYNTLWIPGTDHAGIATQWMVERMLREEGTSKEAIGRQAFLRRAWQFKDESHGTIVGQLKRLGVSCDWGRERFTLDEGLSRAVRRVFVTLYRQGLIYRALRMVNWSPGLRSAISDLEVDHQTVQGSLWHFRYPLVNPPPGGPQYVVVATTRPETMLGDTAVAVHPEDARYQALVGRKVRLPLVGREIPIVADAYVDPAFGSGAVKITPAHDPNDFQVARRHDLPLINIMHEDASLNDEVPAPYRGMERFAARKRVVADLAALGLLEKEEPHTLTVGICSRSRSVVEPRVSRQWWVKIQPLAEQAKAAVEQGHIRLVPDFQVRIFFEWMNHIEDWCISRQLWWGHRIPVWYCQNPDCKEYGRTGKEIVSEEDLSACPGCGAATLTMDQDVLDTWFSSGLWPFSTMGWPEQTEDLRTFYPTSVLVTGYDILFFWVARMIMLGVWFNPRGRPEDALATPLPERVPFREVLLHGLLRDEHGEKMSKTKGNGLDPLDMIDKYGADALRFTLAQRTVLGQDMSLPEAAIEANRNFINKLWNATKFFLGHVERLGRPPPLEQVSPHDLGRFDSVALMQLDAAIEQTQVHLSAYRFNEACHFLYTFFWHWICDSYLEMTKPVLQGELGIARQRATLAVLQRILEDSLKLLHPLMPFVTEELWHALPGERGYLMVQGYPAKGGIVHEYTRVGSNDLPLAVIAENIVRGIWKFRAEHAIKPRQPMQAVVVVPNEFERIHLSPPQDLESEAIIRSLASVESLRWVPAHTPEAGEFRIVGDSFDVYVSAPVDVAQERQRLARDAEKTRVQIEKLTGKLANPAFVDKAPAAVVEKNRQELATLQAQLQRLTDGLSQLQS